MARAARGSTGRIGVPCPESGGGGTAVVSQRGRLRGIRADHGRGPPVAPDADPAWCVMRNHWHFVVWPREDGELTAYFRWLAHTHAMRWHVAHGTVGAGICTKGVSRAFRSRRTSTFSPCAVMSSNALTGHVVERAEDWRWGSLWARRHSGHQLKAILSDWPVERPPGWLSLVNGPMTEKEAEGVRTSIVRNRPYGSELWQDQQAKQLGLLHTLRGEGRPKAVKPQN